MATRLTVPRPATRDLLVYLDISILLEGLLLRLHQERTAGRQWLVD
jgi:hypothetical protein